MSFSITKTEFVNAVTSNGYSAPSDTQYNGFATGLKSGHGKFGNKTEVAMFLAHVIHETGGLQKKTETDQSNGYNKPEQYNDLHDPSLWKERLAKYPGRTYHGRGYLQLTWLYNYWNASYALFKDDRLCRDPSLVATDEDTAWKTAYWFWGSEVHPKITDFESTIDAINGAVDTESQRKARRNVYAKVKTAFGL